MCTQSTAGRLWWITRLYALLCIPVKHFSNGKNGELPFHEKLAMDFPCTCCKKKMKSRSTQKYCLQILCFNGEVDDWIMKNDHFQAYQPLATTKLSAHAQFLTNHQKEPDRRCHSLFLNCYVPMDIKQAKTMNM